MSSNLNIENKQIVIDITENSPRRINKDEWEKCCKYIAILSITITFVFLVMYVYNYNF